MHIGTNISRFFCNFGPSVFACYDDHILKEKKSGTRTDALDNNSMAVQQKRAVKDKKPSKDIFLVTSLKTVKEI